MKKCLYNFGGNISQTDSGKIEKARNAVSVKLDLKQGLRTRCG